MLASPPADVDIAASERLALMAVQAGETEVAAERSARLRAIRDGAAGFAERKRLASLRSGIDYGTVRPPLTPLADDAHLRTLVEEIEAVRA